jgi:hypothetical protein
MRYARFLLLLLAVPAVAKTPDGKPPSVETVCDGYKGAAYGLCNSYCEARDCDDPRVHASDRSCAVTEAKFLKMTGEPLVCSSGPPAAACKATAAADAVADLGDGYPDLSVLDNDTVQSAAGAPIAPVGGIGVVTPAAGVTVNPDGTLTISPTVTDITEFTYEVCCDSSTCSRAKVTVIPYIPA